MKDELASWTQYKPYTSWAMFLDSWEMRVRMI